MQSPVLRYSLLPLRFHDEGGEGDVVRGEDEDGQERVDEREDVDQKQHHAARQKPQGVHRKANLHDKPEND